MLEPGSGSLMQDDIKDSVVFIRETGFIKIILKKQISPRALLLPVQVLGRTGQRLTGGSSQMRPTQHR